DCLGENRLPRAGLPGDGVEPRGEGKLGLVDEDEVLDAEAAEHGAVEMVSGGAARHHRPRIPRPLQVDASSLGTPHLPPLSSSLALTLTPPCRKCAEIGTPL